MREHIWFCMATKVGVQNHKLHYLLAKKILRYGRKAVSLSWNLYYNITEYIRIITNVKERWSAQFSSGIGGTVRRH